MYYDKAPRGIALSPPQRHQSAMESKPNSDMFRSEKTSHPIHSPFKNAFPPSCHLGIQANSETKDQPKAQFHTGANAMETYIRSSSRPHQSFPPYMGITQAHRARRVDAGTSGEAGCVCARQQGAKLGAPNVRRSMGATTTTATTRVYQGRRRVLVDPRLFEPLSSPLASQQDAMLMSSAVGMTILTARPNWDSQTAAPSLGPRRRCCPGGAPPAARRRGRQSRRRGLPTRRPRPALA